MTPDPVTTLDDDTPSRFDVGERPGLTLTVLWHADLSRVGAVATVEFPQRREPLLLHRHSPLFDDGQPLADPRISRSALQLLHQPGGSVRLWPSSDRLRYSIDGRRCSGGEELSPARLEHGVVLGLGRGVLLLLQQGLRTTGRSRHGLHGVSSELERVRASIDTWGPERATVLVAGPSGVGKELVSRALHDQGAHPRSIRERPFVAVNMAALGQGTAASQLFGHASGSFTGARRASSGFFGQAQGGTLFLDEIGACPPEVQGLLLRALEVGEIQPVGGSIRQVEVRVVAATDENLERAIREGRFRAPLLFRLAQRRIDIPPLARRPADIAVQALLFLRRELNRYQAEGLLDDTRARRPWLGSEVIVALLRHDWPGNTRELKGAIEQLVGRGWQQPACPIPELGSPPPEDPEDEQTAEWPAIEATPPVSSPPPVSSRLLQRLPIVLARNDYRLQATARELGISRNRLRRQMQNLGLPRASELSADQIRAALRDSASLAAAARQLRVSLASLRLRMTALDIPG